MAKLQRFDPPAMQDDFVSRPRERERFLTRWSQNLNAFTQQAILGNPWNSTYASNHANYANPLNTDIPDDAIVEPVSWQASPNRIDHYFGPRTSAALSQEQRWELADRGCYPQDGKQATFPHISADPCTGHASDQPFGPYGPRGWQDEYCEWSVTCDRHGNMTRIDITCENPEYWYTLWSVDPDLVCELYRTTLDKPNIQVEDLYLTKNEQIVIDPSTGNPAYDPLNKWNSGPLSSPEAGGAMHLTSTPNTLQAEIGLAASATAQRQIGHTDPLRLICCAQYGEPFRHSDPHIGRVANQAVAAGYKITLSNPPGLYIQMPDFSHYSVPGQSNVDWSRIWQIRRGRPTLQDESGADLPGNYILHVAFEVPEDMGFTMSDIEIYNEPLRWAVQIMATMEIALNVTAIPATVPPALPCVGAPTAPLAAPLQVMHTAVWSARYGIAVQNPVGFPMNLASNTVLAPPLIQQGPQRVSLTVTADSVTLGPNNELPTVDFPEATGIKATVTNFSQVNYAVPGNSYPKTYSALLVDVDVPANCPTGDLGVRITNHGQQPGPAAPGFITIAPARSAREA